MAQDAGIDLRRALLAWILEREMGCRRLAGRAQDGPQGKPPSRLLLRAEREREAVPPRLQCRRVERVDVGSAEEMLRDRVEVQAISMRSATLLRNR